MKNKILSKIMLVSALTACAFTLRAASLESNDMTQAIEAIRKKRNLPALAVIVVKDGTVCDRYRRGRPQMGRSDTDYDQRSISYRFRYQIDDGHAGRNVD